MDGVQRAGARIRSGWPRLLEMLLIAILIVHCVRLLWVVVTPVGPLGQWRGKTVVSLSPEMRASLFRGFDAFYPAPVASGAQQNVTSLSLTLYGVRVNEGSGQGSAILAGEDGVQGSYAVGDEIMPGVMLKEVAFDHVVIERGGIPESVYLDQSQPVSPVTPPTTTAPAAPAALSAAPSSASLTPEALKAGIGLAPRMSNGRATGLILSRRGPAFDQAGLRDGDVIVQINGRPVGSAGDMAVLQQALAPGARISLSVERGASVVPIALLVP